MINLYFSRILAIILFAIIIAPFDVSAKMKIYTLTKKVRGSDFIFFAELSEIKPDRLILKLPTPLKGKIFDKQLQIKYEENKYDSEYSYSLPDAGSILLIFANLDNSGIYNPFGRVQGVNNVDPKEIESLKRTIEYIINYDDNKDSAFKTKTLISMLSSKNDFIQYTALEIIYTDRRKHEFSLSEIVPLVFKLLQSSNIAISSYSLDALIALTGQKGVIPYLIEAMGSDKNNTAVLSCQQLKIILSPNFKFELDKNYRRTCNIPKSIINDEFEYSSDKDANIRKDAANKLMNWWKANENNIQVAP